MVALERKRHSELEDRVGKRCGLSKKNGSLGMGWRLIEEHQGMGIQEAGSMRLYLERNSRDRKKRHEQQGLREQRGWGSRHLEADIVACKGGQSGIEEGPEEQVSLRGPALDAERARVTAQ